MPYQAFSPITRRHWARGNPYAEWICNQNSVHEGIKELREQIAANQRVTGLIEGARLKSNTWKLATEGEDVRKQKGCSESLGADHCPAE